MDNQTQAQTRAEAERLLGISEKLLHSRDLTGSREFAQLAIESDSFLEGPDQILAITEVLLASEKRVNNNRHHDWYAILQTAPRSEPDLLRKNYRRLALLLHPDKNNYPFADSAFKLVADAWAVLSDPSKRTPYDHELSVFSKVDLRHQPVDKDKLPVRRSPRAGVGGVEAGAADNNNSNVSAPPASNSEPAPHQRAAGVGTVQRDVNRVPSFWTACPYCYVLYEYPSEYKEYVVRCQNCERSFQATGIPSMPPLVPGKEAYYCCWGFFPLGFSIEGDDGKGKKVNANNYVQNDSNKNNANNAANASNNNNNNPNMGFPNWMPGMFTTPPTGGGANQQHQGGNVNMNNVPNVNTNVRRRSKVVDFSSGSGSAGFGNIVQGISAPNLAQGVSAPGAKKRGRPRKNPIGV